MTKTLSNPKLFAVATLLFALATFANAIHTDTNGTAVSNLSPATLSVPGPEQAQNVAAR
jgi:hypothetical protein